MCCYNVTVLQFCLWFRWCLQSFSQAAEDLEVSEFIIITDIFSTVCLDNRLYYRSGRSNCDHRFKALSLPFWSVGPTNDHTWIRGWSVLLFSKQNKFTSFNLQKTYFISRMGHCSSIPLHAVLTLCFSDRVTHLISDQSLIRVVHYVPGRGR